MESDQIDLIAHIKKNSKYSLDFERLDEKLLDQLNGIGNGDIEEFHKIHYIGFENFGFMMKKRELMKDKYLNFNSHIELLCCIV